MTNHIKIKLFFAFLVLILTGCAHSYYYLPEIKGAAAMHGRGDIIYAIPAKGQPALTMTVRSLGIKKVHDKEMLGIRMTFVHLNGTTTHQYLNPTEQIVRLGVGGTEFKPAYVHSKKRNGAIVELVGPHDVIELLFPLTPGKDTGTDVSDFFFQWKIHYASEKSEQQVARFDRHDATPQESSVIFPEDNDYPYDVSPMDMPGWYVERDPFWWPLNPF